MTRPAPGPATGGTGTAPRPLMSLLAHSTTPTDLLPHLHQHALDVTGGSRSLLFQHNPRNGALQATSGFGLDALRTDPWLPGPDEATLVADAFSRGVPTLVTDAHRQTPDLAGRLDARAALLLPLVRGGGTRRPARRRLRRAAVGVERGRRRGGGGRRRS